MPAALRLFLPLLLVLFGLMAAPAGAAVAPERSGLALTFTAGERHDTREARLVALFVPEGQTVSPLLPAGPFTASWDGSILAALRVECTFAVECLGEVTVTINGEKVLAATKGRVESQKVSLKKGANPIKVEFRRPEKGDALVRLMWATNEFPYEPVPATALSHPAATEAILAGASVREGRQLFAERRCIVCHDAAGAIPVAGAERMPELDQDAPVFTEFGARFNETWLAHWINDPHSIRPHSLMPRIFAGSGQEVDQRAADLAAYLSAIGKRNEGTVDEQNAPLGGALFANLGCVACHTTPDFQGQDEFNRVPLAHVKAKWQEPALREYLRDPQKFYRWSRMPNFRLTETEAQQLAAFLLSGTQTEFAAGPKGDAAKGAQLAVSSGCLNCHAGMPPTTAPKLAETIRKGWKSGCLADDATARGKAPDFGFTTGERESLRALAAQGMTSLAHDSPAEFATRQVKTLRCQACHTLDAEVSVWSQLEGEMTPLQSGAPAPEGEGQPIAGTGAPMFTWLGEKLKPEWAAKFIAGEIAYKPRPWLIARMPGFGTVRAEGLAHGLAMHHGFPRVTSPEAAPDPVKVKGGETLIGDNGGFNCTTCHGVGDRPPTAVFEAPGINLAYANERLRTEYFHRWVYFPLRIDPETKMPRFSDDEGKTPLTELFDGKAREQFEAIREYLRTVPKPPLDEAKKAAE